MLETSVADPDPVPFWLLDPGSGMGEISGSRSGMNNPDHIFEVLETIFWVKIGTYLNSFMRIRDPESGIRDEKIRIREGKIRIRDPG
jgi:hypothetical protein